MCGLVRSDREILGCSFRTKRCTAERDDVPIFIQEAYNASFRVVNRCIRYFLGVLFTTDGIDASKLPSLLGLLLCLSPLELINYTLCIVVQPILILICEV